MPIYWGLEGMTFLCLRGHLAIDDAIETAKKIHQINKKHITEDILKRFIEKLKEPTDE